MPLDLVVPDLLLPVGAPEGMRSARLPALERWLARADKARRPESSVTALLSSAFALPSPAPLAAIALAAEGAPREGTWMRADPVHLRVDHDAVALHPPSVLEITREEAAILVAELQQLFGGDGLEFHALSPDRWYVRVPESEAPRTVSLEDALGRNVFGLLPRGSGRINWPSALTETQMLFSNHAVNARRESEGRPAINSVWFWGEGAKPASIAAPYALIYADDYFARGLGALSNTRVAARPSKISDLDTVRESESALVLLDPLCAPLRRGDEAQWKQAAEKLDDDWFVELAGAIDRFEAVRLILPTRKDTLVANLTAGSKWRWYRSRKPLASHA